MTKKLVFTIGVMTGLIAGGVAFNANNTAYAATGCLSGPDRPSGPGTHWHYRIDRVTKERCWYLKKIGGPSRPRPSGEARSRPSNEERAGVAHSRRSSETRTRPTSEARANPPEASTENESSIKAWFTATFAALSGSAASDTKTVRPELITREPAPRKRRSNEAERERSEKSRSEHAERTKTARVQQRPSAAEAAGDKDVTPPPSNPQPEWEKALYEEFLQWRVRQLLFE